MKKKRKENLKQNSFIYLFTFQKEKEKEKKFSSTFTTYENTNRKYISIYVYCLIIIDRLSYDYLTNLSTFFYFFDFLEKNIFVEDFESSYHSPRHVYL